MPAGLEKVAYLYQARRVATQANAAGGAIKIDITVAAGQVAKLIGVSMINSGTNGILVNALDEDGVTQIQRIASVGSGAGTYISLPTIGSVATATQNMATSEGLLIGPGSSLALDQTGAGAQNDTSTIGIMLLLSTNTEPTWSKARSTNQADVTLAASTISTANTLQAVVNL